MLACTGFVLRDARIFTVASIPPVAAFVLAQAPVTGSARQANISFTSQSINNLACTFQCLMSATNLSSQASSLAVYSRARGAIALGTWQTCTSPEVRMSARTGCCLVWRCEHSCILPLRMLGSWSMIPISRGLIHPAVLLTAVAFRAVATKEISGKINLYHVSIFIAAGDSRQTRLVASLLQHIAESCKIIGLEG